MKRIFIFFSLIVLLSLLACQSPEDQTITPEWLTDFIEVCETDTTNSIDYHVDQIWRYEYKGNVVFYFRWGCCDFFNKLYDYDGNYLGAPDGGWAGTGDGTLTDFNSTKTNGELIWTKPQE
jgi:uncharacterized protein DUF6970